MLDFSEDNSDDSNLSGCSNPDHPLVCQRCQADFPDMIQLLSHIKSTNHEGALVGCKFCERFSFTINGKYKFRYLKNLEF